MLFNSYVFTLLFLPVTAAVFYMVGSSGRHRVAIAWLVAASLFFYAWWNPAYVGLIFTSTLINYGLGIILTNRVENNRFSPKAILIVGIGINIGLLGYFKYAGFIVHNVTQVLGFEWQIGAITLPLAISFFTFQQITYLVDAYRGETKEYNFLHYCLFVMFFPQLIAGPIVHHREILPQFSRVLIYRFEYSRMAIGITMFVFGLFKKVVLADNVSAYATPVFSAAENGEILTLFEAWGGALAYTFQLYFDFSGYSDMAIGLGCIFGVELPVNFNSPYKATNIIEFWRRWHMTLSRFLRDYCYIPLGGNRGGEVRRYGNLMATMLVGGLWHGADWTFVAWGGMHGIFLAVNHGWRAMRVALGDDLSERRWWGRWLSWNVTFIAVVAGWVVFRSPSFGCVYRVFDGMMGRNGIALPAAAFEHFGWPVRVLLEDYGWEFRHVEHLHGAAQLAWTACLLLVAWVLPNTQEVLARARQVGGGGRTAAGKRWSWLSWYPNGVWASVISLMLTVCLLEMSEVSEFLYFQF